MQWDNNNGVGLEIDLTIVMQSGDYCDAVAHLQHCQLHTGCAENNVRQTLLPEWV